MGSMIAALSMIVLGFTQEIVGFFVADEKSARGFTITLAVLAIYAVDFAINAGELTPLHPEDSMN